MFKMSLLVRLSFIESFHDLVYRYRFKNQSWFFVHFIHQSYKGEMAIWQNVKKRAWKGNQFD